MIGKRLLGTAVVTLGVLTTPAQAATLDFHTLYLFGDAGYEGNKVPVQTLLWNESAKLWVYMPTSTPEFPTFNDKASSLTNNDSRAWVVFDDKNYRDRRYCVRPGETVPNLGAPQFKFNDKVSSAQRLDSASCAGHPAFFTIG